MGNAFGMQKFDCLDDLACDESGIDAVYAKVLRFRVREQIPSSCKLLKQIPTIGK